ncbi:hypothetical protein [Aestuariimicrobium ganziense]|nr:hypothetical protein [Aestuariimicrobium ganziense]
MFTSTPASILLALTPADETTQQAHVTVFGRLVDRLTHQAH